MLTPCKHCTGCGTEPLQHGHRLHALQNQPCISLNGDSCSACRAMISLEAKILDAQATLLHLFERHRSLREEMNETHSLINQRMAPEIMSSIFRFCIDDHIEDRITFPAAKIDIRAPYTLAAVCKTWRTIASSTPHLWNQVYLSIAEPKHIPLQAQLLREWLSCSGDLPLKICAEYSDDSLYRRHLEQDKNTFTETPFVDTINHYSSRWQDLYLSLPGAFLARLQAPNGTPRLRTLYLTPYQCPPDSKWQMHHATPQNLHLDFRHISYDPEMDAGANMFNVDWRTVTRLDLLTHFPRVIQHGMQASNLQYLKITIPGRRASHVTESLHEVSLSHSNIKEFSYQCLGNTELVSFDFPAAVKFHIDLLEDFAVQTQIERFKGSLERSPFLTDLTIFNRTSEDTLIHILHSVPALESLSLSDTFVSFWKEDGFFEYLSGTAIANPGHFLPNLRTLSCSIQGRDISWTSLPFVFGPLEELTNPTRRPLTSFAVHVSDIDFEFLNGPISAPNVDDLPMIIPHLRYLKDAKLNLEVRHRRSNRNLLPWPLNEQSDKAEK